MKVLEVVVLLLVFGGIFIIDKSKLSATANKMKYSIVYCSVLTAGLLLGTLELFKLLPTFNSMLIDLYDKILSK